VAGCIDGVPVLSLWVLAVVSAAWVLEWQLPPSPWNGLDRLIDLTAQEPGWVATAAVMGAGVLMAWHQVGERLLGASPGKRVMGLRVIDSEGERPGMGSSLVAGLCGVLSVLSLGFFHWWAIVDEERRTLGDRLAGVWVIREHQR
jgi:uncharacterized RDD family membrane protein YckC